MQAPLALIGSVAALVCSWREGWFGHGAGWLAGGVLLLLVIPFTLIVIFPTNRRLESRELDVHSTEAERLLRRWGRLHAVRSVLSGAAFLGFVWMLVRRR